MDQNLLVSERVDAGRALLSELRKNNFDVAAAFWVQRNDDFRWFMYIVTPLYDSAGPIAAYRAFNRIFHALPTPWGFPNEPRLIGPSDRMAQDIFEARKLWPPNLDMKYQGNLLGRIPVEDSFVYAQ